MTDHRDHQDQDASEPSGESLRTGNARVDEVLAGIDQLDDAEVAAHVAVFEHAHEQLRGALDISRP